MPESDNLPKFVQLDFPFIELPTPALAPVPPPKPKRRRVKQPNRPILNDMSTRYAVYGTALFAFVRSSAELSAMLESGFDLLRKRRVYNLDPLGCSPLRRAIVLRYNRRAVFLELGRAAVPLYVAASDSPAPAFLEFPDRVITAFTAQCVREFFRVHHGDPDYDRA